MLTSPKILIFCPAHFATTWGTTQISDCFNSDGNLVLRCDRNRYTEIREGETSRYQDYYNSIGVIVSSQRVGFSLEITDQREELLLCLKELRKSQFGSDYSTFMPVTIWDWCKIETWEEFERGYAIRTGMLDVGESKGSAEVGQTLCDGSDRASGGRMGLGFNLRMIERAKQFG